MSYFPIRADQASSSSKSFAVYTARVSNVPNAPRTVTASFSAPAIGGSVTVSVNSTLDIAVGHALVIGDFVGRYEFTAATGNYYTVAIDRPGNWEAGTTFDTDTSSYRFLLDPAAPGLAGTLDLGSGATHTVPSVASRGTFSFFGAGVTATVGTVVPLGQRAGVYRVTAVNSGANTLTLTRLTLGDVAVGTAVFSGVAVTTGYMLGITRSNPNTLFYPTDIWWGSTAASSSASNNPALSIGYSPNTDFGASRDYFGDLVDGFSMPSATEYGTIPTNRPIPLAAQSPIRTAVPPDSALMAFINPFPIVSVGIGFTIMVRGFYSEA